MPVTIHCPTCRHPLTAHEARGGTVVTCPTCHQPLTVPAFGEPSAPDTNPFELPSGPPTKRTPRRGTGDRKTANATTLFFIAVGLLVAAVMCFILYDRFQIYSDKKRLNAIEDELIPLMQNQLIRERELQLQDKRLRDPLADREAVYQTDAEWKRLNGRISELDFERSKILRTHPQLRR